jgi:hypothetical protein
MLFGFLPGPVPLAAPAVSVWGFKANGIGNAGYLNVGQSANYAPQSNGKYIQMTQQFGDVTASTLWWSLINDPDWVDTPINEWIW